MGFTSSILNIGGGSKIRSTGAGTSSKGSVSRVVSSSLGKASQSIPFDPLAESCVKKIERWDFEEHNKIINSAILNDGDLKDELEGQIKEIKSQIKNKKVLNSINKIEAALFNPIYKNELKAIGPDARMGVVYFCCGISKYERPQEIGVGEVLDYVKAGIEDFDCESPKMHYSTEGFDPKSERVITFMRNVYKCSYLICDLLTTRGRKWTK